MRPVMFYTILTIAIIRAIERAPTIDAVKLETSRLVTSVNRSEHIASGDSIRSVSVSNPDMVEVVAVGNKEFVVNAKVAGETTLTVWTTAGRKPLDLVVLPSKRAAYSGTER